MKVPARCCAIAAKKLAATPANIPGAASLRNAPKPRNFQSAAVAKPVSMAAMTDPPVRRQPSTRTIIAGASAAPRSEIEDRTRLTTELSSFAEGPPVDDTAVLAVERCNVVGGPGA